MIKNKLEITPHKPGCYLMKNSDNNIIYVGKAKDLNKRLHSYFRGNLTGKTAKLVEEIYDFEYLVVNSEIEAFILELNLIKKHNPKYNILLRDDKSYPYIELVVDESPRLQIVRNLNRKKKKNSYLYGPYPNAYAARSIVNLLNRMYPLRKCATLPKKPCLYYYLDQCYGYCFQKVDQSLIDNMVADVMKFLNGDATLVIKKIKDEMQVFSDTLQYEKAKELKELLEYIDIVLTKQKVEIKDNINLDVFGYFNDKDYISIQVFFIRGGKIIGRHFKIIPEIGEVSDELNRYIADFYNKDVLLPHEILVPSIIDKDLLSEYLNIKVSTPLKGDRKKIMDMALENARITLSDEFELIKKDEEKTVEANNDLMITLNLNKLDTINIFDISHLFGTYNVGGMVVFRNGKPYKKDYRKYKITADIADDYSAIKEVIYRRYFRMLKEDLTKPDLIIIDGGIGQINAARTVLSDLNINIPIIGLKKDRKHQTSALLANSPIIEIEIDKRSPLFHYLERMQEEVHEYTINYHRVIRSKGLIESRLDNISGLGLKRKNILMEKYNDIEEIKKLTKEELMKDLPEIVAENVVNYFRGENNE